MLLSDFFPASAVVRDAEFAQLCLSNSEVNGPALSFLEDRRYADELFANPAICAVICKADTVSELPDRIRGVVADNPRLAYFSLHNRLAELPDYKPPLSPSVIPASCRVSPLAYIAPTGVELGENVIVGEFVSIQGPCRIGSNSVLYAGVRIGGVGFETKYNGDDVLDVTHCGSVEIGENVVLWEDVSVHRAVYPWDSTRIGNNCRIGAKSHIDHGVKLASCVKICAGCTVSGRTVIDAHAFIGPGSVVSNRIHIGEKALVRLGSVVTKDVPPHAEISGNFAVEHSAHLAHIKTLSK